MNCTAEFKELGVAPPRNPFHIFHIIAERTQIAGYIRNDIVLYHRNASARTLQHQPPHTAFSVIILFTEHFPQCSTFSANATNENPKQINSQPLHRSSSSLLKGPKSKTHPFAMESRESFPCPKGERSAMGSSPFFGLKSAKALGRTLHNDRLSPLIAKSQCSLKRDKKLK